MARGILAGLLAMGIKYLFYWISGYNPFEEIDSVLKYLVDFGFFMLVYAPADYLIGLLKIGRKREEKKEPAELL